MIDITILTDSRYYKPSLIDPYIQNILDEDNLVKRALEKKGFSVNRTHWDNKDYDWSNTRFALFRATWDYFDRFDEFSKWLNQTSRRTQFINPIETILWNLDKHYLKEFDNCGINIPNTVFVEKGDSRSLDQVLSTINWTGTILKPVISGGGRHTYKIENEVLDELTQTYGQLILNEDMMFQKYQEQITTKGEISFMLFGGKYSHAILKKAKPGDFRVQDDFGGTVHHFEPSLKEIRFAEEVMSKCSQPNVYARVDVFWDNNDELCLGELEMIEPELWFRESDSAAELFANAVSDYI